MPYKHIYTLLYNMIDLIVEDDLSDCSPDSFKKDIGEKDDEKGGINGVFLENTLLKSNALQ